MRVDPEVQHDARVLARRAVLRKLSWVTLSLTAAMAVLSFAMMTKAKRVGEIWRAWKRPLPLAQIALLTLGGGGLAKLFDEHEMSPFLLLGAGSLGVYLASTAWSVAGSDRISARVARAVVCLVATLAVAFLTMDTLDPMMLEGINL